MRLVADIIRGKSAATALSVLRFSDKGAAEVAERTLKSAINNLQQKDDAVSPESIIVKEVFVDPGPTIKRISPAPMGRAYRIRKRSHHLTIVVASTENAE